jgi:hypothetical protein
MKQTEFFTFILPPNAWSKRPYRSRWKMTREDAAKRYPGAEPDLLSREVRDCPETPEELKAIDSGALHTAATAHRKAT